jgi:hypothetical protein
MSGTVTMSGQPTQRLTDAFGYRPRHAVAATARGVAKVPELPADKTRNGEMAVPGGEILDFALLVDRAADGSVEIRSASNEDLEDIARRMAASKSW